jgi:hypothetical protein
VWEPSPNLEGGPADAPKTAQPAPLPATNLVAPVQMLLGLGLARSSFVIVRGGLRTDEREEGGD